MPGGNSAGGLTELAAITAAEGVRLAYHHHMGTVVQSEQDIDTLMDVCGGEVDLLLDTGHATFAGCDPVALARRHAPRIRHFHAKDYVMAGPVRRWQFTNAPGYGFLTRPG
jgi:inosose dehydratase